MSEPIDPFAPNDTPGSRRMDQIDAAADGRYGNLDDSALVGFIEGAHWADANPQPHTITRAELAEAFARAGTNEVTSLLRELGIEVRDE